MRLPRILVPKNHPIGIYHPISRIVDKQFLLGPTEKNRFIELMYEYADFCGVLIPAFEIMDNHFHIVAMVPARPDQLPTDEELNRRLDILTTKAAPIYKKQLKRFRQEGNHQAAEELRNKLFDHMWDLSAYMKLLLERFTQGYNKTHNRTGTLWEGRFKSTVVEGGHSLARTSAYVDLNCVRAKIVADPINYRWGSYGRACAGDKRALEGLRLVVASLIKKEPHQLSDEEVFNHYRLYLYLQGEQNEGFTLEGRPLRLGFDRQKVVEVVANGGKVSDAEFLRCRVRHFSAGVVMGSKEFVNEIFEIYRHLFGKKRKTGARRVRGLEDDTLYTLRDLRKDVVT